MCYSILRTKYRKSMTGQNPAYTECSDADDERRKLEERQGHVEVMKIEIFRCASTLVQRVAWDHTPYVPPGPQIAKEETPP